MFDQNDQNQQAATTAPAVQSPAQNTTTLDLPDMTAASSNSTPIADSTTSSAPIPQDTTAQSTMSTPAPDPINIATTASEPELTLPSKPAETTNPAPAANSDLMTIKKEALQNLTPLLDHLDQTPDEKFRTTMMLIQASDDQSLVQAAYKAAQEITDEKVKAQALLDIINEINYFTQNSEIKTAPPA